MLNELKDVKDKFIELLVTVAVYICRHEWQKVGTKYEEVKHICVRCGTTGWQYRDDVPYVAHLINRLNREAQLPIKAAAVLVRIEEKLKEKCKSYTWTENDSIQLGKAMLARKTEAKAVFEAGNEPATSVQIIEQTFADAVLPKYHVEDYSEIKKVMDWVNKGF